MRREVSRSNYSPTGLICLVCFLSVFLHHVFATKTNLPVYQMIPCNYQRWSRGHKARGQGEGHKKIRGQGHGQPFRGQTLSRQGQKCSRPRTKDTNTSVLKKKVFKNFFQAISKKNGLEKKISADLQIFNHSKNSAVLEAKDVLEDSTFGDYCTNP